MLQWVNDDSGRAECTDCGIKWTPKMRVLPPECNQCRRKLQRMIAVTLMNEKKPTLVATVRALIRRGTIDIPGMQAEVARLYDVSRQHVHGITKKERANDQQE